MMATSWTIFNESTSRSDRFVSNFPLKKREDPSIDILLSLSRKLYFILLPLNPPAAGRQSNDPIRTVSVSIRDGTLRKTFSIGLRAVRILVCYYNQLIVFFSFFFFFFLNQMRRSFLSFGPFIARLICHGGLDPPKNNNMGLWSLSRDKPPR